MFTVGALGGVNVRDSATFLGPGLPVADWPVPPAPTPGLGPSRRILASLSATDVPAGAEDDLGGAGVGTALRALHGVCVRACVCSTIAKNK